MLIRLNLVKCDEFIDLHRRQRFVSLIVFHIICAFLIHGDKARLNKYRAIGAYYGSAFIVCRHHIDSNGIEYGSHHLASHGALPDQAVELKLVIIKEALNLLRRAHDACRTDAFMSFLSVLRFRLIHIGLYRQVLVAVAFCNKFTNFDNSFSRQRDRVGTHIGNEANRPFARIHAFVQFLCRHHGAPRIETQFSGSVLLQGRSRKRRCWVTATLFLINSFNS